VQVFVLRYNTYIATKEHKMSVKAEILAKLAEIETLLQEAECDGAQLAELECFEEVDTAVAHLSQVVDYYVD
jgi:hypothetical protein